MSNGNGHHWSKFCWRDWRSDGALHPCSLAAKGFWIEMLCLMHEGEPVGHLTVGGKSATLRQMAANAYCTEKEATRYLAELEEAGVFSRTEDGTIYSRRMVKDAATSEQGRAWGKTGGNPALKPKANGAHPTQGGITPPLTQPITPRHIAPPNPYPLTEGVKPDLESEIEEEPPRGPPVTGGVRRRRQKLPRNGFRGTEQPEPPTIDGKVEEFEVWLERQRRIGND